MPTRQAPSFRWWYEHLEAFPETFRLDGAAVGDDQREQGLLKWLLGELTHLLPSSHAAIYLVHADSLALHIHAVTDPAWREALHDAGAEQIRNGLLAWTFKSGHPAIVESHVTEKGPCHSVIVPLMTPRSIIGACLILQASDSHRDQGGADGVRGSLDEISVEQLKILSVLGQQFAAQTENHRLFGALETHNRTLEAQVTQRTSELEAMLHSLEHMNQALIEASRLKSQFLANTSHELRTPLNSILGFLHLLNDGLYANDEERTEFIQYALDSSRHLLLLINDLLDLAKVESLRMIVKNSPVPLVGLFDEVRAVMEVQARRKGLSLTFDNAVALTVHADPLRLKQALVNLIGNAIKFTAEGGVRVCAARDTGDSDSVQITVTDTGIGIAAHTLERLGEPFARGDETKTGCSNGAGLGLALSRSFIELMGGTLTLSSAGERAGTTALVRLRQQDHATLLS